jgi:hypothetical protein
MKELQKKNLKLHVNWQMSNSNNTLLYRNQNFTPVKCNLKQNISWSYRQVTHKTPASVTFDFLLEWQAAVYSESYGVQFGGVTSEAVISTCKKAREYEQAVIRDSVCFYFFGVHSVAFQVCINY